MKTTITFEISEVASRCGVNKEEILRYISYEWIQPHDPVKLRLDEDDIVRIHLILDLQLRLGVNDDGVPVILHLIDQLNHLHLELR